MPPHQAGTIWAVILFAIAALLIACTGCTEQADEYGSNTDSERGVCASVGQQATTSLSHGGYVTRCGLPE